MYKKLFSVLCLMAVTLTFTTSCSEDDEVTESVKVEKKGLTLVADVPETEAGTRTEIGYDEKGSIVPMWSTCADVVNEIVSNDFLYAIFDGQPRYYKFVADITGAARTAKFNEVIPEGMSSLREDLAAAGATEVYFIKSPFLEAVTEGSVAEMPMGFLVSGVASSTGSFPSTDDILVSKPIAADKIINCGDVALPLSFKRLNGIIRVNITEGEGVSLKGAYEPYGFTLANGTKDTAEQMDINFGGIFVIDCKNAQLLPMVYTPTSIVGVVNDNLADMYPAFKRTDNNTLVGYCCTLPITLNEGDSFQLILMNSGNDELAIKTLTVGNGGIQTEAGVITTFNITINKEDLIPSSTVYSDKPGTLTEEVFDKAMTVACERKNNLNIIGSFNAKDFGVIRDCLSKPFTDTDDRMVFLSTKYLKIVSDDTYYTGPEGQKIYITEDDTFAEYMFWGLNRLKGIFCPNSLKTVKSNAIGNNDAMYKIYFERNLKTVEKNAITFTDKQTIYDKFLSFGACTPETCTDIAQNFIVNSEAVTLELNKLWFEPGTHESPVKNSWKGCTWYGIMRAK